MPERPLPIIGHHLIWTLYGHWLSNDLRGSGSIELYAEKFEPLGPIHHGRKPEHLQPSREELKEFYKEANPLLNFPKFWLGDAKRQAVGEAFAEVVAKEGYTVWAFAILSNHAHLVIRRHRDDALVMWQKFADASRLRLREQESLAPEHPVWASRPYKVFLRTPHEVRTRVHYVESNPEKEGLPRQQYEFVKVYNNWPFHKQ
jgi:REP element-mobilizing transposase RayT